MWSGFSSEIETEFQRYFTIDHLKVACGAASHLRLKLIEALIDYIQKQGRMWSGFSSEIETYIDTLNPEYNIAVACGAASHLRLKRTVYEHTPHTREAS